MSGPRLRLVRRVVGRLARVSLWAAIRIRGRDMTATLHRRPCVVFAPHPDDETLGCGGILLGKLAAGTPVNVVVATDGGNSHRSEVVGRSELAQLRASEAAEAMRVLGLDPDRLVFLGFPDSELAAHEPELVDAVQGYLEAHRVAEIYSTSPSDPHPDHAALGRAVRVAASRLPSGPDLYEYPIWQWRARSWSGATLTSPRTWLEMLRIVVPLLRRPLLARVLEPTLKRRALKAYGSQLRNLSGERGWWTLDDEFLRSFSRGYEVFYAVDPCRTDS